MTTTAASDTISRRPRNLGQTLPSTTAQQSKYFLPRDGIAREVISAEICRYLGDDALVRPSHYKDLRNGQVVEGYYITAHGNLTIAMIEDLKAKSARWGYERHAQTSQNAFGAVQASRDVTGIPERSSSNSPAIQYRHTKSD